MRIFNFLLASDAVGGLGPPEDLVNKPEIWQIILVIAGFYILFSSPFIIYAIVKRIKSKQQPKGDE